MRSKKTSGAGSREPEWGVRFRRGFGQALAAMCLACFPGLFPPCARAADAASTGPPARPYILGPGDQVVVRVSHVQEITERPIPIDMSGDIDLPMAGRIRAAGLDAEQLKNAIGERLKRYLVEPDVSVYLAEVRSQPVSVLGAVQSPGVYQIQGSKTLFEVLSLAGGLRPDAGDTVKITREISRGAIPLANAAKDPSGRFYVASVDVKSILSAANPAENIQIKPNDVISAPKAEIVYAIGAVKKPGGYVLGQNRTLGTLQVLSLAEGFDTAAATGDARIIRVMPDTGERTEIPVDLKKVLANKVPDIPLKADDILFVPTSATKRAALRSIEALIQIGTYATYRIP
jgi:polysaccharide biosynthesis/export protein